VAQIEKEKELIYGELLTIHQQHGTLPWTVVGDFNIVRFYNKKTLIMAGNHAP